MPIINKTIEVKYSEDEIKEILEEHAFKMMEKDGVQLNGKIIVEFDMECREDTIQNQTEYYAILKGAKVKLK
jgi:hypothetical protein